MALDSWPHRLSKKLTRRKCKAVELRYFGGLSMDEIAQALDVSAGNGAARLTNGGSVASTAKCSTGRCHLTPERWAQIEELFHRAGGVRSGAARPTCWMSLRR